MTEADLPRVAPRQRCPADADPGFGVYVHWPFCLSKCPYCDFNSHVAAGRSTRRAISRRSPPRSTHRASLDAGPRSSSIFFGGGTPSLMRRRPWRRSSTHRRIGGSRPTPRSRSRPTRPASRPALPRLSRRRRQPAVDRRSGAGRRRPQGAGAQAHGRGGAAAVGLAASIFPRFTFDLIYGRPGQSEAQWRAELARALDLAGDHVSLYQLTIEPDTISSRCATPGSSPFPTRTSASPLFTATRELTRRAACRPTKSPITPAPARESRHNLIYWRYGEYAGSAPERTAGSSPRRAGSPRIRAPPGEPGSTQVESEGHGLVENPPLSREEQGDEFLLMGLRLSEGSTRAATRRSADGSSTASGSRALSRMGSSSVTRVRPPQGHPGRRAPAGHGRRRLAA